MTGNLAWFAVAALLEIGGCFAFWLWMRGSATPWLAVLGVCSLIGFALALTRVDAAFAGRAYAAYGGVYIAASLLALGSRTAAADVDRLGWGRALGRRGRDHHRFCFAGEVAGLVPDP